MNKITVVLDCGTVVNPDIVKAQVESAVLQGLAAAMWQDMPFVGGVPTRQNFGSYRMGKMTDAPVINVTLMKLGIISEPLPMLYTEGAVIMGMIHFLLPYMILNVYVAIEGIDKNLISAARTLGCTS